MLDCARSFHASARKTCFHCFCSNSVNFYRIKIFFNVFWEPLKNLKQWLHFCHSMMACFAIAGVFTYACTIFLSLHAWTSWFSAFLTQLILNSVFTCSTSNHRVWKWEKCNILKLISYSKYSKCYGQSKIMKDFLYTQVFF